ncbi:MAG: TetR/AcrR family transcriptional regulator [Anaerolineales bacterium]|jgi:AcrR family transcriptional regulator
MEDKRTDRRVLRTRRSLKDALLALILEEGYDSVTIEEITERADLGRTTFYLHYKDKEELLLESISELVDDLVEQTRDSKVEPILLSFYHARENADLYRIILRGEGAFKAIERLRKIVAQTIDELLGEALHELAVQENTKFEPRVPMKVFINYFSGSLLGIMTWWLEEEEPYSPEEMAEMFQLMFFQGALQALGIDSNQAETVAEARS